MKKLFLLSVLLLTGILISFSQDHIIGITKTKTPVFANKGKLEIAKLQSSESIYIEDVTPDYFIIQYKGGNAYIYRLDVKFRSEELKKLKEYRKANPLIFKEIDLKKDESMADKEMKNVSGQIIDISKIDDKTKFEIDHIRYCAGKYKSEIMTGYTFSIIGTIVSTVGAFTDNPEIPVAVGAGIGLIGTILIIDSNKWMNKIYIGPSGIGIRYKF